MVSYPHVRVPNFEEEMTTTPIELSIFRGKQPLLRALQQPDLRVRLFVASGLDWSSVSSWNSPRDIHWTTGTISSYWFTLGK